MSIFARIVDGSALDIQIVATINEAESRFHKDLVSTWNLNNQGFIEVPDGTKHNAKDNGDGTFTNPVEPVMSQPIKYDAAEFSSSIKRKSKKLSERGEYNAASYLLIKHGLGGQHGGHSN